ncbi:MAG: MATE family efflux transporter [Alphaproteobacteria bacterium]
MAVLMFVGNHVFMQYLGDNGVGAFGVCCYYAPFVFMVGNAIAQSAQPIISYNFGLGDWQRVKSMVKIALATALGFGILTTAIFTVLPHFMVGLFLKDGNPAAELAIYGFPYFAAGFTFFILNLTSIGYFQSLERIKPATFFALLRGCVFLVPAFIFLPKVLGVHGIWLAMPMSECLTFAMIALYYLKQHYQQRTEKK